MTDAVFELPAASFDLPLSLSGGTNTTLRGYAGKWVVLYFYPKDSTPGCTTEGLDFNALLPQFTQAGAVVLGVSRDSVKSHDNFCAKQGFTFPLVSDGDEALCRAFDVIKEKNMYGKQVLGIERSTFLLSPEGVVVQAWRKVKVAGHADAVLAALKAHARQ
ncbi:peroxiredoxin [Xanthomonas arboricola]|uniref:thioredoxin-dependent peroxiredoxin n=1 Tax=Xanthomonas arboricola pv. guizotiae TaxID=487867 RepID=A0A2S7A4Y8_9XANT|nr:peroxiredoxin [Xanthomonas arboricola]AKC77972.1 thiol peroxidase [Xanthomonas arboricola]MBB5860151.1 peroxiredoxin Q/BCP [Xanthomonas arboricola]OBR76186.1 thiol peroxidase [Xanthomonas arboricola]PPT23213.1 peroxiredoxin [Xanthomonas arboricola]PPU02003.1 peroxiredoxin [Xanthomonas arboricola pv. guizotiae]